MKKIISLLLLIWIWLAFAHSESPAQKPLKMPSKIGNALVLEFIAPFDRILIDTDEEVLADRENVFILVGTNTKILDVKGKPFAREAIRTGMKTEIKLEPGLDLTNLIAAQIKVKTNPGNEAVTVKGFLDKVVDEEAFLDGKNVILMPNAVIVGDGEWKNKTFSSFKDVPLGSVLELKGTRREDGSIYATQGQVKPNLITPLEKQLIQLVQKGLVLPPPDKPGAGVTIGKQTFKVVENLELNTYVTRVGYKVIPRYLKNLQDGDPNKILFRFYVLDDDTPNAVAFPDGSVFINTGLLRRLDNEAQLAVILGHEIAHVSVEHPRRTLETAQKQAFWMGLAGVAAGVALGQEYGRLIGQIGFGLLSNKFSRDMEDQADRIGLFYAFDAGYDIRESTKIWRKLIGDDYRNNTIGTFLYSDHPSLKSRLRNTRRELLSTYQKADYREVIDGREKYLENVGVFFGWVKPKPKVEPLPPPTPQQLEPKVETKAPEKQKTKIRPVVSNPPSVTSPTTKPKAKPKPKIKKRT